MFSLEAAFYVSVAVRVCLSFLQFNLNVAVSNQVISQLESNSILFTRQSPFKLVFGAWQVSILDPACKHSEKDCTRVREIKRREREKASTLKSFSEVAEVRRTGSMLQIWRLMKEVCAFMWSDKLVSYIESEREEERRWKDEYSIYENNVF